MLNGFLYASQLVRFTFTETICLVVIFKNAKVIYKTST